MTPPRRSTHGLNPDAPPTAAEIQATRNSLNLALGNLGRHQKSWMHHDSAQNANQTQTATASPPQLPPPPPPKRKRGRPPLSSQAHPQIPPVQQTPAVPASPAINADRERHPASNSTTDAYHERHPASNSTSPQLANVVSRRITASPHQSPPPILPSPSPSEDARVESAAAPNNHSAFATGDVLREAGAGNGISQSPQDAPDTSLREAIRQAQNKRPRIENEPYRQGPQVHGNPAHQDHAPALQSHPQIQQVMQSRPSSRNQSHPQLGNRTSATPPQAQRPFGPPRALSRGSAQHPHGAPSPQQSPSTLMQSQPASPGLLRSHILDPVSCYNVLVKFRTQNAGSIRDIDIRRLDVLRDAVTKSDWDYVALHQYYCLVDVDSRRLPPAIVDNPQLKFAHSVLREVLDSNLSLSLVVREFFADFPLPIAQIAINWPLAYEQQQRMFLRFVSCSTNYPNLQQACSQRSFPPLMPELFYYIGVPSIVLQRIIFTAILRHLSAQWGGGPHSPGQLQFETEALTVFYDNQTDFLRRQSNRPPNASAAEEQETNLEVAKCGERLRELCERQARLLRPGSLILPSQVLRTHQGQQTHRRLQSQPSLTAQPTQAMPHPTRQSRQISQSPAQAHRGPGRPRLNGSVLARPVRPGGPPQNSPQLAPPTRSLLPPRGWRQPEQRIPNPGRFALHQAHLRDPLIRAQSPGLALYQYMKAFAQPPKRLTDAGRRIEKWTLSISAEELHRIPKDIPGTLGQPPSRTVSETSLMFRLRGIIWPAEELPNEHAWATADTSFHPYAYFTFNGNVLQKRKKLHYGKDLPIDLTEFIKEGDNVLEIAVLSQSNDNSYLKYLLAIEVVGVKNHESIKQTCLEGNRVPANEVMETIQHKLAPASSDDEIAIIQSSLSITLFDPFSASRICDIPVRSKACLHNDCFDLETFLQTRKRQNDASIPDVWRCPICNADARPQFLIVDGFLQQVHMELAQRGLLETRAIIVDQDGSWKPKADPVSENHGHDQESPVDRDSSADPAIPKKSKTPPLTAPVIDLSD